MKGSNQSFSIWKIEARTIKGTVCYLRHLVLLSIAQQNKINSGNILKKGQKKIPAIFITIRNDLSGKIEDIAQNIKDVEQEIRKLKKSYIDKKGNY